MTHLSRRQAAILAALLDADGATVDCADLAVVAGSFGVNDGAVLRGYAARLRRRGVDGIASDCRSGWRMTKLPPDWALDDVLRALDELRADGSLPSAATWRRAS